MKIYLPKKLDKSSFEDILNHLPDKLEGNFILQCDLMTYIDGDGMMFLMFLLGEMDRNKCSIEIQGLKGQPLRLLEYFDLCKIYCCTRSPKTAYMSIMLSEMTKRIFDIIFSIIILFLTFIPSIIIALLIVIDSPGSPIYRQKRMRISRRRKNWKDPTLPDDSDTFWMYKFRTMVDGAEKETGAVNAVADDARITRIGKFLRKIRLDELPNFINVLVGDMSIVGPRADRIEIMGPLKDEFKMIFERHRFLKPGITGLAQLELNSDGSIGDTSKSFVNAIPKDLFDKSTHSFRYKLFFEAAYGLIFRNYREFLWNEISIILRTPFTMFFKRNVI